MAFQQKKKQEEAALKAAKDKGMLYLPSIIFHNTNNNYNLAALKGKHDYPDSVRYRRRLNISFLSSQVALPEVESRSTSFHFCSHKIEFRF